MEAKKAWEKLYGQHLLVTHPAEAYGVPVPGLKLTHHGICIGRDRVIQYEDPEARVVSMKDFRGPASWIRIRCYTHRQNDVRRTVEKAHSMLGAKNYHFVHRNCEHLATWCVQNQWECPQNPIYRLKHLFAFRDVGFYDFLSDRF